MKRREFISGATAAFGAISVAEAQALDAHDGRAMRENADRLSITLVGPPLHEFAEAEYRRVISSMVEDGASAIVVGDHSEHLVYRKLIVDLVATLRLPAVYPYREYVQLGGLFSYGLDYAKFYSRAADYVDQILRGA